PASRLEDRVEDVVNVWTVACAQKSLLISASYPAFICPGWPWICVHLRQIVLLFSVPPRLRGRFCGRSFPFAFTCPACPGVAAGRQPWIRGQLPLCSFVSFVVSFSPSFFPAKTEFLARSIWHKQNGTTGQSPVSVVESRFAHEIQLGSYSSCEFGRVAGRLPANRHSAGRAGRTGHRRQA